LPLTARSGRRALQARLSTLGFTVDPVRLGDVFRRFKSLADGRTIVGDEDLIRLMS
jgi:isopropylmalate/homocitrate/citramalate synthase